jgi:hypothetical protein
VSACAKPINNTRKSHTTRKSSDDPRGAIDDTNHSVAHISNEDSAYGVDGDSARGEKECISARTVDITSSSSSRSKASAACERGDDLIADGY